MKIHHSTTPLADRVAHVLRNDRERTIKQLADTLGMNYVGISQAMRKSGRFTSRTDGRETFWRLIQEAATNEPHE